MLIPPLMLAVAAAVDTAGGDHSAAYRLRELKGWYEEGLIADDVWREQQRAILVGEKGIRAVDTTAVFARAHDAPVARAAAPWPASMEPVNVRKFGATGDGITDDTKAITAAITVANAASAFHNCGPGPSESCPCSPRSHLAMLSPLSLVWSRYFIYLSSTYINI
jgi:hypothetical protein